MEDADARQYRATLRASASALLQTQKPRRRNRGTHKFPVASSLPSLAVTTCPPVTPTGLSEASSTSSRMFNTQHWPRNSVLSHGSIGQSTAQRAEVLARLKLIKAEVRLEKELQGRTNALIQDLRSKLDMLGDGDETRSIKSTRSNARSARGGVHQQSGVSSSSFGRGSRSSLDGPGGSENWLVTQKSSYNTFDDDVLLGSKHFGRRECEITKQVNEMRSGVTSNQSQEVSAPPGAYRRRRDYLMSAEAQIQLDLRGSVRGGYPIPKTVMKQ